MAVPDSAGGARSGHHRYAGGVLLPLLLGFAPKVALAPKVAVSAHCGAPSPCGTERLPQISGTIGTFGTTPSCLAEWAISRVETVNTPAPTAAPLVPETATAVASVAPTSSAVSAAPRESFHRRGYADEATALRKLREMTKGGTVEWTRAVQSIRVPAAVLQHVVQTHPQEFVVRELPKHGKASRGKRVVSRKTALEVVVDRGQVVAARRIEPLAASAK